MMHNNFVTFCIFLAAAIYCAEAWQSRSFHHTRRISTPSLLVASLKETDYDESRTKLAGGGIAPRRIIRRNTRLVASEVTNTSTNDNTLQLNYNDTALWSKNESLLEQVSVTTKSCLEKQGWTTPTLIQASSWPLVRSGLSVIGQAPTGTGKTVAYALPIVERLVSTPGLLYNKKGQAQVAVLVLAPTRELVEQIADIFERLVAPHRNGSANLRVLTIHGSSPRYDINTWATNPPVFCIATPGRLYEYLNTKTRIKSRTMQSYFDDTPILVLDEADQLLEAFDNVKLMCQRYLSRPEHRQTLLFSATINARIKNKLGNVLSDDYKFVSALETTNTTRYKINPTLTAITEYYYTLPSIDDYLTFLLAILEQYKDKKVIVFFPAARLVKFFGMLLPLTTKNVSSIWNIHSRMSTASRRSASQSFKAASKGVLLSSDVSARGIDVENVALVVQYGAASSKQLYTHRLGRTGRLGKDGTGLLVLLPFEKKAVRLAKKQNLEHYATPLTILSDTANTCKQAYARQSQLKAVAESACMAFLAYYLSHSDQASKDEMLTHAESFAIAIGLDKMPKISDALVDAMEDAS